MEGDQQVLGDALRIERPTVALLDVALAEADRGSSVRVSVAESGIEVGYCASVVPEPQLGLAVAEAVADLHGGSLSVIRDRETVTLVLSLKPNAGPVPLAPERQLLSPGAR